MIAAPDTVHLASHLFADTTHKAADADMWDLIATEASRTHQATQSLTIAPIKESVQQWWQSQLISNAPDGQPARDHIVKQYTGIVRDRYQTVPHLPIRGYRSALAAAVHASDSWWSTWCDACTTTPSQPTLVFRDELNQRNPGDLVKETLRLDPEVARRQAAISEQTKAYRYVLQEVDPSERAHRAVQEPAIAAGLVEERTAARSLLARSVVQAYQLIAIGDHMDIWMNEHASAHDHVNREQWMEQSTHLLAELRNEPAKLAPEATAYGERLLIGSAASMPEVWSLTGPSTWSYVGSPGLCERVVQRLT